jgi:hypothetical protein
MKAISLFFSILFVAALPDLAAIRQKYVSASTSEQAAEQLYNMLDKVDDNSKETTVVAYKAAALTLKAKYAGNLLKKKNYFTKGATLLEDVIKRDSDNYEVRLIRLNIQENAPKITGYHKNKAEDKAFLIKYYDKQPADLKEYTRNFVKMSESFTKEEKAAFK